MGWYLARQKLARREKFPLIVELEPLFQCNLACPGCGKIQHPDHLLRQRMPGAGGDRGVRGADGVDRRR
jgi:MoaA/NifB/PqqE/SkfB family radical SAM enzyme